MKTIRVSDNAHRQLRLAASKSGEYVSVIVDALITQEQDTIKALRHAVHRNHNYSPSSCDACGFIQRLVEMYIGNEARRSIRPKGDAKR